MDAETNYIAYYSGLVHGTRIQRLQKDHCIYYLLTDVGFLLASTSTSFHFTCCVPYLSNYDVRRLKCVWIKKLMAFPLSLYVYILYVRGIRSTYNCTCMYGYFSLEPLHGKIGKSDKH